jgi:hypothetical protein
VNGRELQGTSRELPGELQGRNFRDGELWYEVGCWRRDRDQSTRVEAKMSDLSDTRISGSPVNKAKGQSSRTGYSSRLLQCFHRGGLFN